MVSGGIVLVVSLTLLVSIGLIVVSTLVLSDAPETLFVELHAEIMIAIDAAQVRL
jgi:Tfp pilus assembly protein PilX